MTSKQRTFYVFMVILCALIAATMAFPWATYTGRSGSYQATDWTDIRTP